MNDSYKYKEKEHYNQAIESRVKAKNNSIPVNDKVLRSSHECFLKKLEGLIVDKPIKILDYGCGPGVKLLELAKPSVKIYGIDISPKSIEFANQIKTERNLNMHFEVMDCEKTTFPDNFFDIIADFGTFSSLNIKLAIPEVARILKPDGYLISIETLGHNPFTNLKRYVNVMFGRRTKWSAAHIMKLDDWELTKTFFDNSEMEYFGLTVLFVAPFLRILPSAWHERIINGFERIDRWLLSKRIFQKYAFKTVVVLAKPKK